MNLNGEVIWKNERTPCQMEKHRRAMRVIKSPPPSPTHPTHIYNYRHKEKGGVPTFCGCQFQQFIMMLRHFCTFSYRSMGPKLKLPTLNFLLKLLWFSPRIRTRFDGVCWHCNYNTSGSFHETMAHSKPRLDMWIIASMKREKLSVYSFVANCFPSLLQMTEKIDFSGIAINQLGLLF